MFATEERSKSIVGKPAYRIGDLKRAITGSLEDDKAQDLIAIDLRGKSSVADCMVIASGSSHRHVTAISDHLIERLKQGGFGRAKVEGRAQADWILIDANEIIIHVFRPEVRAFYDLEKMWSAELASAEI